MCIAVTVTYSKPYHMESLTKVGIVHFCLSWRCGLVWSHKTASYSQSTLEGEKEGNADQPQLADPITTQHVIETTVYWNYSILKLQYIETTLQREIWVEIQFG